MCNGCDYLGDMKDFHLLRWVIWHSLLNLKSECKYFTFFKGKSSLAAPIAQQSTFQQQNDGNNENRPPRRRLGNSLSLQISMIGNQNVLGTNSCYETISINDMTHYVSFHHRTSAAQES